MSGASATAAASLSTRVACRAISASKSAVGEATARRVSSRFHSASNAEMNAGRRSATVTRIVSAMAWIALASPMLRGSSQTLGPRVRFARPRRNGKSAGLPGPTVDGHRGTALAAGEKSAHRAPYCLSVVFRAACGRRARSGRARRRRP